MINNSDSWRKIFVLGGVRSGKSRFASERATELAGDGSVLFVATADRRQSDGSMQDRIARHVAERSPDWTTVEEPLNLCDALDQSKPQQVVLVDCMTLWLSNVFAGGGDPDAPEFTDNVAQAVQSGLDSFLECLQSRPNHMIIVANEVGSGVAPPTRLGNIFADMQGTVNQQIAAACDEVVHMVAGIPNRIK